MSLWDDARGVDCKECGEESFRLLEKICFPCWRGRTVVHEDLMEAERRLLEARKRYPGMVSMKSLKNAKKRLVRT